ncbi:MAG: hypothetical protein K2J16_03840 [Clostridia bacterium]|nr:hypothetical protein [Clostridia bacterium]
MTIKQKYKRYVYILLALFMLVAVILSGRGYIPSAYAYTTSYTSVLTDLRTDSEFVVSNYPYIADDYSIKVIQIAESDSGELFLYTYQPCQTSKYLVATDINMSLSESVDGTRLYTLTLLSCESVFCKYLVDDFTVSEDTTRYYNITSIYRDWDKDIDEDTGNDNTKNAVAFEVGSVYRAKTENGVISYSSRVTDVIQIINPYVDYLEYSNGFKFCPDWCRSHYIAFTTDKQIDTLMEADVSFVSRSASRSTGLGLKGDINYGEPVTDKKTLDGKQKGGNAADGFLAKKYEWERIQSVSDFIATEDLKDQTKKNLENTKWVLRFVETEVHATSGFGSTTERWTDISEVTILRLKFITDGKVYNLGAVSDKLTGDDVAGNNNTAEFEKFFKWLSRVTGVAEWVWYLILALIVLAILLPVLSLIFPAFGEVLKLAVKGVAWFLVQFLKGIFLIISLPFRGIYALIQKIRGDR